jgi:hypothetical protein
LKTTTRKKPASRSRDDLSGDLFSGANTPRPPAPPASGGREPPQRAPENPSLSEFAERAYLAYAMSVVKGRALPAAEDGQKPVQRRILYAMRELGNRSDAPFKKSARIVGDVIGKFHPHGDTAVYDAAVRMAQDFTLRYPLIEGQGNFGSRDGDSPAAMRYTEVRLTPFAEHVLLSELDRGTVDFADNYDGSFREPKLLPARLPVGLLNGASGIAVGMATEIPPHNLKEVAEACALTLEAGEDAKPVTRTIKGPDFPGGGQIISSREEIKRAYETGRGSVRVRARWSVEKLARGQYRVAVTELPPSTSAARVLAEIDELVNPKAKAGKKALTPDQQSLKAATLGAPGDPARRFGRGPSRAHRLRAAHRQGRARRADEFPARAHVDGDQRRAQHRGDRHGWAPAPDEPRRRRRGMGTLPPGGDRAPSSPSQRRGGRPGAHPRRPDDRLPQHRQGDQGHPQLGRAEAGPHHGLQALGAAGRGHPRDPPAPAGAARRHQDRARAGGS